MIRRLKGTQIFRLRVPNDVAQLLQQPYVSQALTYAADAHSSGGLGVAGYV